MTTRLRAERWLAAVGGGAIAGPLSIVLHELGHFGAYVVFRFPDVVLRFSSVDWAGSSEFLVTAFPRGQRVHALVPTLIGIVVGGLLWIPWLGPLVLP